MDIDASQDRSSPTGQSSQAARLTGRPGPSQAPLVVAVAAVLAVPLILVLVLVCWVIPAVGWWVGLPLGLAVAVAVVASRLRNLAAARLRSLGAQPADPGTYARFHNVVQGLSLAGGIPEPDLYVVDDDARNLACVADRDQSAIVATTGLLTNLDRIGLEGVMAGAVVRIRSGDAAAATLGAALFGPLLAGPASKVLAPLAALGLRRLLATDRDLIADRATVALTRYPPGLLGALTMIRSGSIRPAASQPASEHLWLVPPSAAEHQPGGVLAPAPLDLRIDVLAEL